MLFKKKNEELSDQLADYQVRESPRWGTPKFNIDAGITIEGYEGEGQLGNVSVTGCYMRSVTYVNITPNEVYQAVIIPCKDDNIKPFKLKLKLTWTKSSEAFFHAGFSIEGRDGKNQINQYIDTLKARGIEPDYGNMKK